MKSITVKISGTNPSHGIEWLKANGYTVTKVSRCRCKKGLDRYDFFFKHVGYSYCPYCGGKL